MGVTQWTLRAACAPATPRFKPDDLFYLDLSLSGHSIASLQILFFSSDCERSEDDLRWLFCLSVHREGRQADVSL